MKKRIVTLALVIALLALMVGGTLAYFQDTDEATNTFTMGNVKIALKEYERVKDEKGVKTSKLQDFTDKQKVYPAVYDLPGGDPARTYDLTVNGYTLSKYGIRNFPNYVDKIVTVYNAGNSDAYVRTIIAVPVVPNDSDSDNDVSQSWLHWNSVSSSDTDKANGWYCGTSANKEEYPKAYADHYLIHNVKIGDKYYDLTVITNVNKLEPQQETAPCMLGFYLDNDLNCDDEGWYMPMADGSKCYIAKANEEMIAENCILVATQAVQVQGFKDAWEAFDASFGEITATNHPWAE